MVITPISISPYPLRQEYSCRPMDGPHWLRVGLASLWKGGKSWCLREKRREVRGRGCSPFSLRLQGSSLHLGSAESSKISRPLVGGALALLDHLLRRGGLQPILEGLLSYPDTVSRSFWWGRIHHYLTYNTSHTPPWLQTHNVP